MRGILEICLLLVSIPAVCSVKESESFSFAAGSTTISSFLTGPFSAIYHMEMDLQIPGNVLFSTRTSLLTTDGTTTQLVFGSSNEPGYANGNAKSARFDYLIGFHQASPSFIIGVDLGNNCLRQLDRSQNNVKESIGICSNVKDNRNGKYSEAKFNHPSAIIADSRAKGNFLITDEGNEALRILDIKRQYVSTFIKDKRNLDAFRPRDLTQESVSGDLYVTSQRNNIFYVNYNSKTLTLLAGSAYAHIDGLLGSSMFWWPREIMLINDGKQLVVVDQYGPGLRLLDLQTNRTSTFCDKKFEQFDVKSTHPDGDKWKSCDRTSGYSLLNYGDKLLVGRGRGIIAISGRDDPTTTTVTPSTTTTTTKITTPTSTIKQNKNPTETFTCASRNITMTLNPGETHADISLGGGKVVNFAQGKHFYETKSGGRICTIFVLVLPAATVAGPCPAQIEKIASASSGKAFVDLALTDNARQHLELPIGKYKYFIARKGANCTQQVSIIDPDVVRRIMFRATYAVKCSFLSDPVSRATLASLVESSFNEIQSVCDKDCRREPETEALLSCSADKLTITWSTNQTYRGDITAIPAQLYSRLTTRLKQMSVGFLKIIVVNRNPPIVYPKSIKIILSSSCQNNKFYTEEGDRCE